MSLVQIAGTCDCSDTTIRSETRFFPEVLVPLQASRAHHCNTRGETIVITLVSLSPVRLGSTPFWGIRILFL